MVRAILRVIRTVLQTGDMKGASNGRFEGESRVLQCSHLRNIQKVISGSIISWSSWSAERTGPAAAAAAAERQRRAGRASVIREARTRENGVSLSKVVASSARAVASSAT